MLCEGCGGKGQSVCQGEPGKGCDHGYYTCPSCNGDGLGRTGDGAIVPDISCGNCNGTGKLRCVVCHTTPGINYCATCNGTGWKDCVASNCHLAREVNWKCPYCVGTGWLHVTFGHVGEINDGKSNIPVNGDIIVEPNGKEWKWGSSNQNSSNSDHNDTPATTKPAKNNQSIKTNSPVPTQPANNNQHNQSNQPNEDIPNENDHSGEETPENRPLIDDFVDDDNFRLEFLPGEADAPKSLSDDIKQQVIDIVKSFEFGKMTSEEEKKIQGFMTASGVESFEDGRIYPLYFEGHVVLDRPVRVSVKIADNSLNGGKDLFIYHIREDGTTELLEDADLGYITYESGYLSEISFNTREFSTFFTSAVKLDLEASPDESFIEKCTASESGSPNHPEPIPEKNTTNVAVIIIIVVLVIIVLAVTIVVVVMVKKKKKKNSE